MDKATVFISYSHQDELWKDRLVKHLKVLQNEDILNLWDDRLIGVGEEWYKNIREAIVAAKVAILLISADFLTSKFILEEEVPRLLQRRDSEGLKIFPIIIKPCPWKQVKWLAALQWRPRGGKPLSAGSDHEIETNFTDIAEEVTSLINQQKAECNPKTNINMTQIPLDFSVQVWTDIAGVSAIGRDVNVIPKGKGGEYKIGDTINIYFRSNRDCYLTLLNIGSSGKLTILFPNAMHRDSSVLANKIYEIPGREYDFKYELQGPPGVEKLKAIGTVKKIELLENQFATDGSLFHTVGSTAAARDISVVKKKVAVIPIGEWAEATWEFKVIQ